MQGILENALNLIKIYGWSAAWGMVILVVGLMVAGMIRSAVRKALDRGGVEKTLVPFLSNLVYYLVLAVVVIAVLQRFGVPVTSLVAVLGAAGLAVGLAMQGTLSNFASGVMLLVFRPFGVADFVEAAGVSGTVVEVGVFSTALNTPDNVRIVVPNSAVWGTTVKNYSANDLRRIDLVMGISYDDDIGRAVDVMQRVMDSEARVLKDPAAVLAVHELADSSVNLVVRPWCTKEDYWALRWDLTRAFKEQLEAAGCSIPYPQRDVHMHQVPGGAA